MSNTTTVTEDQINEFLKWLIELTPSLYVDEKGYPHRKEDGEMIYSKPSGKDSKVMRPIILYGAVITDNEAAILNPFVEGMVKSPESEWFYSILTITAAHYVRMIQKALLMAALESKDKKKEDKGDLELAGILAPWVDKVDEQMIKEYNQLTSKITNYFNIYYLAKRREARIYCGLFDKDFKEAHKKVRAKTWEVLEKMTKQMFETKDFSDFITTSKLQGCPQLDAILRILLKVYTMLNRYMKYLPEEVQNDMKFEEVDLEFLSNSIDELDLYRAKAKYMVPSANASIPTPQQPANNPINNIRPTFSLPGQTNFSPATVGMPGNTAFGMGVQPQFNIGLSFNPGGFMPTFNPSNQDNNMSGIVNTGPFGR